MAEITLGSKKTVKTLKVHIGDGTYSIPLSGSLTISELRALKNGDDDGFTFFEKYIPKEVIDTLTMDEFNQLTAAWKKASEDQAGVELGE